MLNISVLAILANFVFFSVLMKTSVKKHDYYLWIIIENLKSIPLFIKKGKSI